MSCGRHNLQCWREDCYASRMKRILPLLLVAAVLAACRSTGPYESPRGPEAPTPGPPPPPPVEEPAPTPPPPVQPPAPTKQYQLGAASAALVQQAHTQVASGNSALGVATIERALRIEPDNPLLWIELGKVHEEEGRYSQADSMARKALQLAAGDPRAQASAWRLIAESLRARNRNGEAAEADKRATALSTTSR